METTDVVVCPLCRASDGVLVREIAYAAIWDALRQEWGVHVDASTRKRLQPSRVTRLVRCARCSLAYFTPSRAGDEDFYRLLGEAMREYAPDRWEFGIVRRRLEARDEVLDLGCSDGRFLRSVTPLVRRAVGVDHNTEAVVGARSGGLEAYASDFASFADVHASSFDVVCSFHTLEHLSDAASLVDPARRVLRPDGRLFISVPNGERLGRRPLEGLDCPPHHVTRWEARCFRTMAERFGLKTVGIVYEEPDLSHVRLNHRERAYGVLRSVLGTEGARLAAKVYGKVAIGPRRHAAAAARQRYSRRRRFGHSMLVEFRLA